MFNFSVAQITRRAEFVYAALALFALTQGPIYRLWSESATYLTTSPQPSIAHTYFATFLAVQLPAFVVVCRSLSSQFFESRASQFLLALLGWLGLSVFWSMFARYSLPEFVALVFTTSFGIYLAQRFSPIELWSVVAVVMGLGLLLSLLAIQRDWELAVDDQQGYWIGIYYNRNSLAPVAAMALLAAVGIALSVQRRRTSDVAVLAGVSALTSLALLVLWRSESRTSPFALAAALGVVIVWLTLRWGFRIMKVNHFFREIPAIIAVSIIAGIVFFSVRFIGSLASVSGETATFNSRGVLWSVSWSGFLEKPFHGWGWMAAWHTPNFLRQGEWWVLWDTTWSHNGYHDLLLGGGVLSMMLFLGVLVASLRKISCESSPRESIPSLLVISFVLTAATQESFFIGSHFLWALLVAALFAGREVKFLLVDQHNASHITP